MKTTLSIALAAFAALVLSASVRADDLGLVTVVHGVPGLTVDVYVNGALTLEDFAPGTVTDPLELPEGQYDIIIVPADGDPANPAIEGSAFLPAGANVSIVAHLTEAGAPTLSVFVNDVSKIRRLKSRLVVRHVAAAPAVDVDLYRKFTFWKWSWYKFVATIENLINPNEAQAEVWFGNYAATISPAGSGDVVAGPADLTLKRRTLTIVYAVGSLDDGSFALLTQEQRLPVRRRRYWYKNR
jgi:hypothetical protein